MTLAQLISPLEVLETSGDLQVDVREVTDDSRQVRPGTVFVAVKGGRVDGHTFLDEVVDRGAAALVVQQDSVIGSPRPVPLVRVQDSRVALGLLAARCQGDPSRTLTMIGVTGTNGKTTVTHLIRSLVRAAGRKAGVLGTVGYFIEDTPYPASHTTPGAAQLQSFLGHMVEAGLDTAILEVSSHALAMDRVAGCEFDVVVFTNLTQDHLDFHGDMENYFQAKLRLFTEYASRKPGPKRALINIDDARGAALVAACAFPVWTYGLGEVADVRAEVLRMSLEGTAFTVRTPCGPMTVESQLVGLHNVYNMVAAIGVGLELGLSVPAIEAALREVPNVPGRFERIQEGQDFTVVVDYAHTEDALVRLLSAVHSVKTGRVITVFGCGGDRDPGKRPKMGQAAVRQSDMVVVTSDNPRTEDPLRIIQDIERGILELPVSMRADYRIVPDRAEAIAQAITLAQTGDTVVIAGKGHEDYQLVGTRRLNFDDRQVAREALRRRCGSGT